MSRRLSHRRYGCVPNTCKVSRMSVAFRYAHAFVARYKARVRAAERAQPLPDQSHAEQTQSPPFDVWKWIWSSSTSSAHRLEPPL